LPGDGLYPIKTWRYEVLVALARSPASRLEAMQAQEDSYRRDCLAVLALGREVEVEVFGRLEARDGSTWRIGGLPVDVSGADLSAVLVSARPLEGRRLVVDARTEKGRVIGLRVAPAEPLPEPSGAGASSGTTQGSPADLATTTPTAQATVSPSAQPPVGTADTAAATSGAPGRGAPGSGAATRPAGPADVEGSDNRGTDDLADRDDSAGADDKGGGDKGGDSGDDKGGGDKGGGGDDKGSGDKGSGDDKGSGGGGDDKGGDRGKR
jgi:uncharacterized membrane protein YgcG